MKRIISLVLFLAFIIDLSPSVAGAKLVACVGDSDTYGAGLPDREYNCYPAQLERLLRQLDPNWETRNFGVNGAGVLRNGSKPYVSQSAYNNALAYEPDVVVINLGWNDSLPNNWRQKDDFIPDFLTLIDAFAELPTQPKIYICHPIPESFSPWHSSKVIRDEVIPLISQLPTHRDVQVIDLYAPLEESLHLFQPDRIHLNIEGTRLIAEIVAAFITGVRAIPDFNSDGFVDSADICAMVDHWHTSEPTYDIAPPPFGDGIIDVQDLIALAEYLLTYPGVLAHWPLDEAQGVIAYDSVADCDGTLMGGPVWQPDGGMVAGALQLDGVDDFIFISSIPDSIKGPFSVFAWVKGGAPGQVVISQRGGVNWLCAYTSEGNLMTELRGTGRGSAILPSQAVITDGNWHRIGFVWNGSHRKLYVDGLAVAEDTQENLEVSENRLYIGTGNALKSGTYWSGLIDDVRIYNRAVTP
jgi:lysophospholipase L1-like esterase